uniref:Pentacotripeptide-repeat region of PRORP domain-containing protein n=1 Tax=Photinus pyralis TaxID=7054 RepID=A0A1Y1K6Z0_PHOPY
MNKAIMFRKILHNLPKYHLSRWNLCKNSQIINNISKHVPRNFHTNTNFCYAQTQSARNLENEFLVKLKNDPDSFGHQEAEEDVLDPGDVKEEEYIQEKPVHFQVLTTKQYADIIKDHLRKRKLKEAIDIVEVQMIKEHRVKPPGYIYNLLIGGCGRVGYTKKAFSLYNEMKRRGLDVTPGTYTALFNACANSPWPTTDGLSRATHLLNNLREKMYIPNLTNYNVMIKAFGRAGDLTTAFSLVDEMSARHIGIMDDTFNFLLQACITDKEAGFRHALLVWRKLVRRKIKPSLFTYNLMLRCIRDCGLGDISVTTDVINTLLEEGRPELRLLESDTTQQANALIETPNLMAPVPCLGNILLLSTVLKAEDRLLLVGGWSGFLENMADHNCTPDVKTFTQLLDSVPPTRAAEADLLRALKAKGVKPDVDFFNMLIKKRSCRFDYEGCKEALAMLTDEGYRPNLVTYGVLSIVCKNQEEALSVIHEMSQANYRMNIEILGAMLTQACYHNNFKYILFLMETCLSEGIQPSTKFMQKLEEFRKKSKYISNDKENPLSKSTTFQKGYKMFKGRYKEWCDEITVEEEQVHPWQQYRQRTDTDLRHYKEKDAKTRFKPVHTSLYRQKTSIRNVRTRK